MGLDESVEVDPKLTRLDEFHPKINTFHQFRALFLKDLTLQWRSWKTNLCQLLTPVVFILFAGLIQVIVNKMIADHNTPIPGTETPFPPVNPGRLVTCNSADDPFSPHHPEACRVPILNFYQEYPKWREAIEAAKLHFPNDSTLLDNITEVLEIFEEVSLAPCQKELFDLPFYFVGGSQDLRKSSFLGNLTSIGGNVSRSGLVGNMVPSSMYFNFSLDFTPAYNETGTTCLTPKEHSIAVPLFWEINSHEDLNMHLDEVVQNYNRLANLSVSSRDQYGRTYSISPLSESQYDAVLNYVKNGSLKNVGRGLQKVRPQGGIFFDRFDVDSAAVDIHYTLVAAELALYELHFPFADMSVSGSNLSKLEVDVHRRNALVNMVDNAILRHLLGQSDGGEEQLITSYIVPIPSLVPMNITVDIASILGGILYPFSFSFLIPVFMSSLVKDKYEKHLVMMEQNGLSRWTYWLVTYTFNYMLYIPIAIEIAVFSLIFQLRLFTQTNGLVLILTFFLWGHAEVVLGFFLSNFFGRPRTATIVGYLLVITSVVVALLVEALQIFPKDQTPFPVYMMYPPFAFYRLLDYYISACLALSCYDLSILSPAHGLNLVTTAMLYLVGSTVVLMIFSVYLSYVLPGDYGVRRSPFFPIIEIYKWLKSFQTSSSSRRYHRATELDRSPPVTVSLLDENEEGGDVDADVRAEEAMIGQHFPDSAPMVMYQLCKEYPGSGGVPYVAVDSISLSIDRNECFGLLGPNGAGKTTLISVLTGLYEPTSGTARIAGYDIATEINAVHHHLGVCPQFDIHHAELTAEEHLFFYARLKGVKYGKEKVVVARALRQVNLYEAKKKKVPTATLR